MYGHTLLESTDKFRISSSVRPKLVHKFYDLDVEYYLLPFEKATARSKFSKDKWTAFLHTQLTGKTKKLSADLCVEKCQYFDILQQAFLTAYSRVPEFYRKQFCTLGK